MGSRTCSLQAAWDRDASPGCERAGPTHVTSDVRFRVDFFRAVVPGAPCVTINDQPHHQRIPERGLKSMILRKRQSTARVRTHASVGDPEARRFGANWLHMSEKHEHIWNVWCYYVTTKTKHISSIVKKKTNISRVVKNEAEHINNQIKDGTSPHERRDSVGSKQYSIQ